eukprot:510498-Alexandrium_andersonii.AAC.1
MPEAAASSLAAGGGCLEVSHRPARLPGRLPRTCGPAKPGAPAGPVLPVERRCCPRCPRRPRLRRSGLPGRVLEEAQGHRRPRPGGPSW